ncbi:MAG: ATP-binding cassette domain-containing protein [Acidobacteriota bacterium]|nr:ATP-binding cassette domain-containing protein [Acidobacteriota bacterium]
MPGSGDRAAVVRLRSVRVVRDGTAVLEGVDWDLGEGERWAVLGPNGSGKTTLLQVAGMRLLPTAGTVEVLGERYGRTDARALRRRIAFVSGALLRALRPTITAHDIVVTGRFAALEPWWQRYEAADHERAEELLAGAGMAEVSARTFAVLSEGERQQVLLARALMGRPDLLLLDEPAAGLDLAHRERLLGRLASLAADAGAPAMALVTHHLEEIPPGVTHAMLLRRGQVVAAGAADTVVTSEAVSACFELPVTVERAGGRWWARARP